MTPRSTPLEGPDGPSELTRAAVLCSACEQVLRPHLVEAAEWSDPADMSTRARYHGAKRIQGWRRVWSIQTLHDGSPREVTRQHLRAATRLLSDYELGVEGAQHGRNMERVDEGPRIGTDVPAPGWMHCGAIGSRWQRSVSRPALSCSPWRWATGPSSSLRSTWGSSATVRMAGSPPDWSGYASTTGHRGSPPIVAPLRVARDATVTDILQDRLGRVAR